MEMVWNTAVAGEKVIAGDPKGDIPYNANAEFFTEAQAIAGMSGMLKGSFINWNAPLERILK